MAHSFLDTSALVKYYHREEGTQEVTRIIENPDDLAQLDEPMLALQGLRGLVVLSDQARSMQPICVGAFL